jgi:lysylphosphatidylglycerol synthetase-like protein (DUF2156 family)
VAEDGDDRQWIDHPSGYLALAGGNEQWRVPGTRGFVVYRTHGRHLVTFGGIHAPPEDRAALLTSLVEHASNRRLSVLAVQVRADQVSLFEAQGFTVNRFGRSYTVTLAKFTFRGTPKMKLRNKIKRAQPLLTVGEVGVEIPRTAATFDELRAVSQAWLAGKKKKEIEFMVGQLGGPGDVERRVFVARALSGEAVAFITYVPVFGRHRGYLHDLTRKRPDAPTGAMELINSFAIERLRQEGVEYLHFGFTPFVVDGREPASASRLMSRAVEFLARHGSLVYPAQTQVSYKMKWGPDLVETEFLAGRPLSARAVVDLLLLTRSL